MLYIEKSSTFLVVECNRLLRQIAVVYAGIIDLVLIHTEGKFKVNRKSVKIKNFRYFL